MSKEFVLLPGSCRSLNQTSSSSFLFQVWPLEQTRLEQTLPLLSQNPLGFACVPRGSACFSLPTVSIRLFLEQCQQTTRAHFTVSWSSPLGMTDKCGGVKTRSLACSLELTCLSSPLAEVGTWPDMVPFLIPPSQVSPGCISIGCPLLKNPRFGLCFLGIRLRQEFLALCNSSQKLSG